MALREIKDGEIFGPSCTVCGAATTGGKCLSCGAPAPSPASAMAETKLTAEQVAEKWGFTDSMWYQQAVDAINDYAAQQQAEYECPKCHRSLKKGERCIASTCDRDYEPDCVAVPVSYKRRLSEVLAVLREHEWWTTGACLAYCNIKQPTIEGERFHREWERRHQPGCWLAALLAADKEKGNE